MNHYTPSTNVTVRMVLIDDEEWLLEMVELAIRDKFKNLELTAFQDSKEAWQELAKRDPDILVTGANMGELGGEEIVRRLIEKKAPYPVLVMSGWSPAEKWVKAFANKKPNISFLQKPFKTEQLHAAISKLLGRDDQPALNGRQSKGGECKSLLEAATRDLFRRNAFRITGLPVDATTREVARHSDKLKMLAELGQDPHTQGAAFPMKPPPSLDEIREAIQKLKRPEKRLVDEFFWFWPEEFGNSQSDPAMRALANGDSKAAIEIWEAKEADHVSSITAQHNLALVFHIVGLDWENDSFEDKTSEARRQKIVGYWKGAFKRWERLAVTEQLWDKVSTRIRQLNEPNLSKEFVRQLRATLPKALIKINAELAVAYADSGKSDLARLHIQLMRETNLAVDDIEKTAELILEPSVNRLQEQINRAKNRAENNPHEAAAAARELLDQAQQELTLFDLFFDKESDTRAELFDEVASLCNQLPIAYQKATGDDKTCLEILKAILPLATSVDLRREIEKNIDTLLRNVALKELDPIYSLLKQIQESTQSPAARLQTIKSDVFPLITEFVARLRGTVIPPQIRRSGKI